MLYSRLPFYIRILLFLTWLAGSGTTLASGPSPTLDLSTLTGPQILTPYITYFEETQPLSIQEVQSSHIQDRFISSSKEELNFGFVDSVYWFKVSLKNTSSSPPEFEKWFLELDFPFIDHLEAYLPAPQGYKKVITGDSYPFKTRTIKTHSHVLPILIPNNQQVDLYFRAQTTTSLQFPLTIFTPEQFVTKNQAHLYWAGIFYGTLIVMFIYNFFVYLSVRDSAYFYYILYIAGILATNMAISGTAFQLLWPESTLLANIGYALSATYTMLFALLFTRSFLTTKNYGVKIDLTLKISAAFCAIALLFPFILSQHLSAKLAVFIPLPGSLIILITAIYGVYLKERKAYFFLVAWSLLITGIIVRALMQFDFLPNNFFTLYSSQLGAAAEVVLLSFALADRINRDKAERLAAVESALHANEEMRKSEQALIFQNYHDTLTGAPNRLMFRQRLQDHITGLNTDSSKFLICTLHLNNFHDINFTLGHQAGDQILMQAVTTINSELTSWPGIKSLSLENEELRHVALLEGVYMAFIMACKKDEDETLIATKLFEHFSKPIHFNDMTLDLGGHIGIACYPNDDESADALIRKSMIAVRAAKWSKLPTVSYDTNIDQYSESRLSLMGELITAIENKELVLFFQPKIELKTKQVVSLEALIRWRHPKRGLLTPADFIDIAESTGVIQHITAWVVQDALRACSLLREEGYDLSIAVNISVRNLLNDHFANEVISAVETLQFPAEKLILEVIESAVIEDMQQSLTTLDKLNQAKIKLSLDDFGTGYSSLSYLKNLPVGELKLDRSFVTDMMRNKEDKVIVETTIAIAKELNLNVVAEGIEDEKTLNELTNSHCKMAQGYFIQKPLPENDLKEWLATNGTYTGKRHHQHEIQDQHQS